MRRLLGIKIEFSLRLAFLAVLLSSGSGLVSACGKSNPLDAAEQIRAAIAAAQGAAQQRDISTLKDFVADGYKDLRGYEKREVVRLVQGYLLRHRNIHMLSKIIDLELMEPTRASTLLLVAMAGRRIESAEQLWDLRADVFQFDLSWIRTNGAWQVANATWRRVRIDDFFSD